MILKISTIIFSGRKVITNNLIAQIFIVDFFKIFFEKGLI